MVAQKVSILGAGNAGFTIAFHLSQRGHNVVLFEHPDFGSVLEPIHQHGEKIVALENEGEFKSVLSGEAKLHAATTDIKMAIDFADIVILIVPAFGQVPIFELALPHARDGQIFLMMPGNFASLAFVDLMAKKGINKNLTFAEAESIPYACRRVGGNEIFISGVKKNLTCGVFPGERAKATFEVLRPLFTLNLNLAKSILEPGFSNVNMVVHPPPTLLNTGWIESRHGDFSFYREGASKSVCNYIDAMDAERIAIANAIGVKTMTVPKLVDYWYEGVCYDTTYEGLSNSPYHAFFPAPNSLNNRYISEDMAYLLLPIAKILGAKFGVKTPRIDAIIAIAETVTGQKLEPKRGFSAVLKDGENAEQLQARLYKGITNGPI